MKRIFFLILFAIHVLASFGQPKLVVGIVVDQMRHDYIQRYWNKFGNEGFKRLVNEGFSCNNTNYNYVPTFTGPGHASIYTGATPSVHGIVSNEWREKMTGDRIYCADDKSVTTLGGKSNAGQMSPKNLITSTVGEELRKATNNASKVIGIALKDRGAILPAGHKSTAAYWFDVSTGNWISSSYYMKELPAWVNGFNKKESAKKYLTRQWSTLLPIELYTESDADDNICEESFKGKEKPVFPYDLPSLMKNNGSLGLIRSTPFGNSFTKDFVLETIKNEKMGKGTVPDFLCISFSSTDYIGHQFGPQSVEVEDCYLRLDKDIADFLKFMDEWVGKSNALVFLTSDHGASEAVPCLQKKNMYTGVIHEKAISDSLKKFLLRTYKDTLMVIVNDFDVYFDRKKIELKKYDIQEIRQSVAGYLPSLKGIAYAISSDKIQEDRLSSPGRWEQDTIHLKVKAGFYSERSGDVTFVLKHGWLQGYEKGTSHGSPYKYDTHVPLIWWGHTVSYGSTEEDLTITQIAPTVSDILKIPVPNGCTTKAIQLVK
ncbi:MAG: alkaline phosphatase family protein [Bacteroidetes bacterium]|nr:MAG: alkaline phosphatase family protein [Bacteroidota bacterium]